MKTWVKFYTEINRDPKIGLLSWEHRGVWAALLALAGEIDDRDSDDQETGKLGTFENVAWMIRYPEDKLQEALATFGDMIENHTDGILYLPNYPKRQKRAPSAAPAAVAERVKRYRAKIADASASKCNEDVTSTKRGETPSESESESESASGEKTATRALPSARQEQNTKRAELEQHFAMASGLPVPRCETTKQKRSAGELWWGPLREILELQGWDDYRSKNLIDLALARMRESRLTVSSPKSILNVARAIFAEGAQERILIEHT